MSTFRCKSRDGNGRLDERTLSVATRREAIAQLQASGLLPIAVDEVSGQAARPSKPAKASKSGKTEPGERTVRAKRIPQKDVGRFTDQLAGLMGAGVPILAGIAAVGEQTQNESFREVLKAMYADVKGGMSLSGSMQRHPQAFTEAYVNSVAAGEASGTLEQFLSNLAEFIEADLEVRNDVRGALLYPAILITTLGLAVTVLVVFVVPRFARLYGNSSDLPLPTKLLMGVSSLMTDSLIWVLSVLALAIWAFVTYTRTADGRRRVDELVLKIPIIGKLIDTAITLRVMQMMALFQQVGMPVIEGLRTIGRTVANRRVRSQMQEISEAVASGESLSSSMAMAKCFSPAVRQMIASGESSGSLAKSFATVAGQLKKDLKHHTKNLAICIEPILTVFLAVVVLFVALAAFLPMWNLAQVMRS